MTRGIIGKLERLWFGAEDEVGREDFGVPLELRRWGTDDRMRFALMLLRVN